MALTDSWRISRCSIIQPCKYQGSSESFSIADMSITGTKEQDISCVVQASCKLQHMHLKEVGFTFYLKAVHCCILKTAATKGFGPSRHEQLLEAKTKKIGHHASATSVIQDNDPKTEDTLSRACQLAAKQRCKSYHSRGPQLHLPACGMQRGLDLQAGMCEQDVKKRVRRVH